MRKQRSRFRCRKEDLARRTNSNSIPISASVHSTLCVRPEMGHPQSFNIVLASLVQIFGSLDANEYQFAILTRRQAWARLALRLAAYYSAASTSSARITGRAPWSMTNARYAQLLEHRDRNARVRWARAATCLRCRPVLESSLAQQRFSIECINLLARSRKWCARPFTGFGTIRALQSTKRTG